MQLLSQLKEHYSKNLPFVSYRKPHSDLYIALLQKDLKLESIEDFAESGFIMAPFADDLPVIRIRPDEVLEERLNMDKLAFPFGQFNEDAEQSGKAEYVEKVNRALEAIQSKALQKVVLSRKITKDINPDPFYTFQIMLRQFPEAFCYFLHHPRVGIWMGASPEVLLKHSKDRISTVSLAGTQKVGMVKDVVWSAKELREQEYVTHYIEQALKGLADSPEVSDPRAVRAGNLLHLESRIEASNPRVGVGQFVKELHPTPAVCGIPVDEAKAFLQSYEGYPRTYYTGYLGELNWGDNNESHLFVNLRCMNFLDNQVHVYVGGGLVEGSDPELEWQETVHKSESMLHLLRNSMVGLG